MCFVFKCNLCLCLQPGALDFNNQLLAPGGKGMWGSWGKGSSGGTGAKPASGEQGKEPFSERLYGLGCGNGLNVKLLLIIFPLFFKILVVQLQAPSTVSQPCSSLVHCCLQQTLIAEFLRGIQTGYFCQPLMYTWHLMRNIINIS